MTAPAGTHAADRTPWVAFGFVLMLGSAWGLSFSLSRLGAVGGIPPAAFAFWQAFGGAVLLLIVNLVRRVRLPLDAPRLRFSLVAGIIGIGAPQFINVTVLAHLPAGLMALLVATVPLWVYGAAALLRMERPSLRRTVGTILGLAGVLTILLPRTQGLPDPALWGWVLLGLTVPLCFATANLHGARHRPPRTDSLALANGMLAGAAVALLPVMLATGPYVPFLSSGGATPADAALMGQMGISAFAYLLFFEILRRAGAVVMSQTGYVTTLAGLIWGVALFGERHGPGLFVAGALILGGVLLVNWPRRAAVERA